MNFFKKLFGNSVSPSEEEQKEAEGKEFDVLKYDGMRAFKTLIRQNEMYRFGKTKCDYFV